MTSTRRATTTIGALAATAALGLVGTSPAAAAEAPPRVTGLSNFFDYCVTGSTLAVPLLYGIGTSTPNLALGQFPPEASSVTQQILVAEGAGPQVFELMAPGVTQFIDTGRHAAAPLAAYNDQFNTGLTTLSETSRATAISMRPVIQPADVTLLEFAAFLDSLQQQ